MHSVVVDSVVGRLPVLHTPSTLLELPCLIQAHFVITVHLSFAFFALGFESLED
jgi:hypothetical protein